MYQLTFGYNPAQPQQLPPSIAPQISPGSNYSNTVGPIAAANLAAIRSTWPQESWSAQTGARIAGQLATPWVSPTVFSFRTYTYTLQGWSTQKLIGGGVGAIAATTFVQQTPAVSIAAIAAVRSLWPEPQWDAQAEMTVASIFAMPANLPSLDPIPPAQRQASVIGTWPVESWIGQSESAIAGGLANVVPPRALAPSQNAFASLLAGGVLWPRETWGPQTAPHTLAWLPAPITAVPAPVPHNEIRLWPPEQWPAQESPEIASQFATVQQQIPPLPVGTIANIQASWPREQWNAQTATNIAAQLASVKPPTFVNNPPIQLSLFAELIGSWPQPSWPAQTGANIASQIAQAAITAYSPVPNFQPIQALWPRDSWYPQSEGGVAGGIAPPQPPPVVVPKQNALSALLVSLWPTESWKAQTGPQTVASWLPPLVTAIPYPPPHNERLLWPQESWPAQESPEIASQFATASEPQPYPPIQQQIVSIWPQESWKAQGQTTIGSLVAPVFEVPFVPTPTRFAEILAWPQPSWAAQSSPTVASQLAGTPAPITPILPAAVGTIRFTWAQESWDHQRGARNAAAFAQPPAAMPFISIPTTSQLINSWPQPDWKAQQAPGLAYLFAIVQPKPPPVPVPQPVQPPSNLGYKVTTRNFSLLEIVTRQWGGEFRAPDHRVYEFSNGRGFDSTDMTNNGIYRKP